MESVDDDEYLGIPDPDKIDFIIPGLLDYLTHLSKNCLKCKVTICCVCDYLDNKKIVTLPSFNCLGKHFKQCHHQRRKILYLINKYLHDGDESKSLSKEIKNWLLLSFRSYIWYDRLGEPGLERNLWSRDDLWKSGRFFHCLFGTLLPRPESRKMLLDAIINLDFKTAGRCFICHIPKLLFQNIAAFPSIIKFIDSGDSLIYKLRHLFCIDSSTKYFIPSRQQNYFVRLNNDNTLRGMAFNVLSEMIRKIIIFQYLRQEIADSSNNE